MKKLLVLSLLFLFSCEDDRLPEPEENIQMFVNGSEIVAREYYESVTTFGASEVQEDGCLDRLVQCLSLEQVEDFFERGIQPAGHIMDMDTLQT